MENQAIYENLGFWKLAFSLMENKPLVIPAIILCGVLLILAIGYLRTGKSPFSSNSDNQYARRTDLKDTADRIAKSLTEHDASNEKDFKDLREQITKLDDDMNTGFRDLTMRIDNILNSRK